MVSKIRSLGIKPVLVLYCLVFYTVLALFDLFFTPQISLLLNDLLAKIIISEVIIKNLVWTIPAILLIKHFKDEVLVSLKEMFTNKVNWLKYLPIFLLFTVYILVGGYLKYGKIGISPSFAYTDLIVVLFVGLTEELFFRGWLLNASIKGCSKNKHGL